MCGEQADSSSGLPKVRGSSPRVRGAGVPELDASRAQGIIPACAGSSYFIPSAVLELWDHPRVCGEQVTRNSTSRSSPGSSPRVRGAVAIRQFVYHGLGIIPACAGSRRRMSVPWATWGDHPRVCGEQVPADLREKVDRGSSPRVRGAARVLESEEGTLGSSPRVRGADRCVGVRYLGEGIIPACAGSRSAISRCVSGGRDHPRVCGEQGVLHYGRLAVAGSSPRVRGAAEDVNGDYGGVGIIPACAGSRLEIRS